MDFSLALTGQESMSVWSSLGTTSRKDPRLARKSLQMIGTDHVVLMLRPTALWQELRTHPIAQPGGHCSLHCPWTRENCSEQFYTAAPSYLHGVSGPGHSAVKSALKEGTAGLPSSSCPRPSFRLLLQLTLPFHWSFKPPRTSLHFPPCPEMALAPASCGEEWVLLPSLLRSPPSQGAFHRASAQSAGVNVSVSRQGSPFRVISPIFLKKLSIYCINILFLVLQNDNEKE